jgi:probable HAF family extracellular repeat protein
MRRFVPITLLSLVLGCDGQPTGLPLSARSNEAVSDATHSGNPHFYLLPPLVKQPSYTGTFDGSLSPRVSICEWNASRSACAAVIAEFPFGAAEGRVAKDAVGEKYYVNWKTTDCLGGPCALDPAKVYRIRFFVGAAQLGFADVSVVANGSELRDVATSEVIGLVDGKTLPIKFRIELGAVAVVGSSGSISVGAGGGLVAAADGKTSLDIPAGALGISTPITIQPVTSPPEGAGPWAQVVDLGPSGTSFDAPVTLTVSYDPSGLPTNLPDSAFAIFTLVDGSWEAVPGAVVNRADHSISAPISHFSYYTAGIIATNSSLVTQPTTITLGQSTFVTARFLVCCWSGVVRPVTNTWVTWGKTNNAVNADTDRTRTDSNGFTTQRFTGVTAGQADVLAGIRSGPSSSFQTSLLRLTVVPPLVMLAAHGNSPGLFADSVRAIGVNQAFGLYTRIPAALAAPLTISLSHRSSTVLPGLVGSLTIPTGATTSPGATVIGRARGGDTIIATAPGYAPDTIVVTVGTGRMRVAGWPASLGIGDSAAVKVEPMDPSGRYNDGGYGIMYGLSPSANLRLSNGNSVISSIPIIDATYSTATFYVKAVGGGPATLVVSEPNSATETVSLDVVGQPLVLQPKTVTSVPGWVIGQTVTVATPMSVDLALSLSSLDQIIVAEPGTGNYTYGGQTGAYVLRAGSTSKGFNVFGLSGIGVNRLVASAPGMSPDTSVVTLVKGVLRVDGWPTSLQVGDSVALQVQVSDSLGRLGQLAYPISLALSGSGIAFSIGGTPITSVEIPQSVSPTFYLKATATGSRSISIANPDYRTYTNTFTATAPPAIVLSDFGTGTAPFRKYGLRQGTGIFAMVPNIVSSPVTVTLTHTNTTVANSTGPTVTIKAGFASEGFTVVAGTVPGRDTLIASAPGYSPDTLVIETDVGGVLVIDWPTSLAYGDSAAIRIRPMNQDSTMIDNAWFTTFALSSNGRLSFSRNGAPITSIAVPDGSSSTPVFYVKGIGGGVGTMNVTNAWYETSPYSVPVTNPPSISASPTTLTIRVQQGQVGQATINVTNGGGATLTGLEVTAFSDYFVGGLYPWITASLSATTAPSTITITAAPPINTFAQTYQTRFGLIAPGAVPGELIFYSIFIDVTPAPPTFTVQSLGVLGGSGSSEALTINGSGRIVGYSNQMGFYRDASAGSPTQVPNPIGDIWAAYDVNAAGVIAWSQPYTGYTWNPSNNALVGPPPGPFAQNNRRTIFALNNTGLILACSDNGAFAQNYVWDVAANTTTLIPGAYNVCLGRINDAGVAVANADPGAGGTARLWNQATQSVTVIPSLGGVTMGRDLNASSITVGRSDVGGRRHAFRYDPATGVTRDLGTLGGLESEAVGINDAGDIVGWSLNAAGQKRGFIWNHVTERMYELPPLPGDVESGANDINQNGVIVGYSAGAGGIHIAARWTPK